MTNPPQTKRRRLKKLVFAGLIVLVTSIVADRVLGWLGFPDDVHHVAPPNYERHVAYEEFEYDIQTNDLGIRYRTIRLQKPKGTHRLVLLGDSFTDGTGVEVTRRWSNLIEQRLSDAKGVPVELINCGEAGTSPIDYVRTYLGLGKRYDPDVVLVGLYHNDISNTIPDVPVDRQGWRRWAHRTWPRLYTLAKSALRRRQPSESFAGSFLESARKLADDHNVDNERFERWKRLIPPAVVESADQRRLNYFTLTHPLVRPRYYLSSFELDTDYSRRQWETTKSLLNRLHDECKKANKRLGVVLFPCVYQFDPRSARRLEARLFAEMGQPMRDEWLRTTRLEQALQNWADTEKIPLLNLSSTFRAKVGDSEPLSYRFDVHFTRAGHVLAAETIYDWLQAEQLIP